jgi:hypothetical protein
MDDDSRGGGWSRRRLLAGGAAAVSLAGCLGGGGSGGGLASLPNSGDGTYVGRVETFESAGAEHVSSGTEIDYERIPPLSGPHYGSTVEAGFYDERQPLGALVHTLEHGAVVIYYDPGALTDEARSDLEDRAATYTDPWASVVVVPSPTDDPAAAYTLTAWRRRLRLDEYDPDAVTAFLAEYLGRGPENPVR